MNARSSLRTAVAYLCLVGVLGAGSAAASPPEGAVGNNLLPIGDIRAAESKPAGWLGPAQLSRDAHSPPYALLIKADRDGQIVRVNASLGRPLAHGVVSFWIKALRKPAGVRRPFAVFIIALRGGREAAPRAAWYMPQDMPAGRWQHVVLRFHFPVSHDDVVIAPRIGEGCAAVAGAYLIDDVEVYRLGPAPAGTLNFEAPVCLDGRPIVARAKLTNDGGGRMPAGRIEFTDRAGHVVSAAGSKPLAPGQSLSASARITVRPGRVRTVCLQWSGGGMRRVLAQRRLPGARSPTPEDIAPAGRLAPRTPWVNARSCGIAMGGWAFVMPIAGMRVTCGFIVLRGSERPVAVVPFATAFRPALRGGALWLDASDMTVTLRRAGPSCVRLQYVFAGRPGPAVGPAIYLGVGEPGHGRRWALFPGLEMLPPEEPSSSWRYAVPPYCWRWRPDPRMVTIPLMAADAGPAVVGLLWDAEAQGMPQPYFASPNRPEEQDDTAMRLEPTGRQLEALLFCRPAGSVFDAVDEWMRQFRPAPMPPTKRTMADQLRWMGEPVEPHRTDLRRQITDLMRAARRAAASQDSDGGWRYEGPSDKARDWLLRRVASTLEKARRQVGDPHAFTLDAYGRAGDTALGQCVFFGRLETIARAALLTGDPQLVKATVRGLEFCRRNFKRPEGAETWEIPLHAPDLLAAAHAIPACLDGWRITGDGRWLDVAIYWARTGLPFIYLWSAPDRQHMSYASIPVFGASYFVVPWFGRSVQFIGMHYARAIWELAPYDPERPWRKIAEGITRRCMTMQIFEDCPDPAKRFFYPDSWSQVDDTHTGADIHPGDVKANCLMILGLSARADTAIWRTARGRLHLTPEGRLIDKEVSARDGRAVFETPFGDPELVMAGPAAPHVDMVVDGQAPRLSRVGHTIYYCRLRLSAQDAGMGPRRITVRWKVR